MAKLECEVDVEGTVDMTGGGEEIQYEAVSMNSRRTRAWGTAHVQSTFREAVRTPTPPVLDALSISWMTST